VEGWAPVPFLPGGRASELRRRGALILHHGLVVVTSLRLNRQPHHPLRLLDLLRPHPSRVPRDLIRDFNDVGVQSDSRWRRDDEDGAGGGAGLGAGRAGPTTTPTVPPWVKVRVRGGGGGWRILIDNRRGAWEQWED
jgi:hypothetical protein